MFKKIKSLSTELKIVISFIIATALLIVIVSASYGYQKTIPQQIPGIATNGGVLDEANKRYTKLSWFSNDPDFDYQKIYVAEADKLATVGLTGYFIDYQQLDPMRYYVDYIESWGQTCSMFVIDDPQYVDGSLTYYVYIDISSNEALSLCSTVELPTSVIAYEVVVKQHADEHLYYLFKKVTLPVKYVLVTE